MKELLDNLISLMNDDNTMFLAEFPTRKPLREYERASEDEIREFERKFNIVLPDYLKEYLMYFNPVKVNLMFVEILGLKGVSRNYDRLAGYSEILSSGYFPVSDEDGDIFCINTSEESGKLYHYSHETEELSDTSHSLESYLTDLVKQKEDYNRSQ